MNPNLSAGRSVRPPFGSFSQHYPAKVPRDSLPKPTAASSTAVKLTVASIVAPDNFTGFVAVIVVNGRLRPHSLCVGDVASS